MVRNFSPDGICFNAVYTLCPEEGNRAFVAVTGKRAQTGGEVFDPGKVRLPIDTR